MSDGNAATNKRAVGLRGARGEHTACRLQSHDQICGIDAAHVAQGEIDCDGFARIDGAIWAGFGRERGADIGDDA